MAAARAEVGALIKLEVARGEPTPLRRRTECSVAANILMSLMRSL
jgi:hypothetical protein